MYLSELKESETAKITAVSGEGELRQHFLDMGVLPGSYIRFVKCAPLGDPMEFTVHGYELTLRKEDAGKIEIVPVPEEEFSEETDRKANRHPIGKVKKTAHHPGLGEGGKYHERSTENRWPQGTVLTFALVGNQNCGKTTLFNQLTGSSQHVGNFPGVTVDRKDGKIRGHEDTLVTDLPGIYSMSPYTPEELISRDFILNEQPKGIINIIDATNIERNLYLSMQLLELGIPMVVALNMMDEVRENGGSIDINLLEEQLGVPVVPISAAKNEGIDELIDHAIHVATYREPPRRQDFCREDEHGGAIHRAIHGVMELVSDHAKSAGVPLRFAASKLLEGDEALIRKLDLDEKERQILLAVRERMERESGMDHAAAIADMRFDFIMRVAKQAVKKPTESKEHERSRKWDSILTGKFTAIPAFLLIMGVIFYLTFGLLGPFLQGLLQKGIDALSDAALSGLQAVSAAEWLQSLLYDGIGKGVGSIISFLPVIILLFFFLSILEDSGYMARVAFVMDKPLRKLGLSGRSIVPLLIGFGCTVPGVMATRTLPSERDRKMTILLTPFMSCTAKLPIYSFFAASFFEKISWAVIIGIYLLNLLLGILASFLYRKTFFRGDPVPFVMELPNYRLPGIKNVLRLLWEKAKDFLVRAFTVIFIASILIWFLQNFNFRLRLTADSAESILAAISGKIAPVFRPLGFGSWQNVTALITGVLAKESVVSTLNILYAGNVTAALSLPAALAFLVFCSIYTPCAAAISSVRRELGRSGAFFMVVWQCVLAWLIAFLFYRIGLLIF